eukprot:GHVL01021092.1.p1 GENE.GHVL01021092.1~~GHVL01021092.1.p1  ORF type:complete len:165 (-),score=43.22 GHVL01021092.1:124-555(-)
MNFYLESLIRICGAISGFLVFLTSFFIFPKLNLNFSIIHDITESLFLLFCSILIISSEIYPFIYIYKILPLLDRIIYRGIFHIFLGCICISSKYYINNFYIYFGIFTGIYCIFIGIFSICFGIYKNSQISNLNVPLQQDQTPI